MKTNHSKTILKTIIAGSCFLALTSTARADMYFNSSEPGCDGSDPSVLFCDDFERGGWAETDCDGYRNGSLIATNAQNYAPNNGWCMNVFFPSTHQGFPALDPAYPNYGVCGGAGAAGTKCAATSSPRMAPSPESEGMMGSHALKGGPYREVYVRAYLKNLPGYAPGHEKMLGVTRPGGDQLLLQTYNAFGGNEFCSIAMQNQDTNTPAWQCQNQGNTLLFQNDHWFYIEYRVRLNTPGSANGEYDLWMDDCGTSGTGCAGPGTLRARYTGADSFYSRARVL